MDFPGLQLHDLLQTGPLPGRQLRAGLSLHQIAQKTLLQHCGPIVGGRYIVHGLLLILAVK